MKLPSSSVRIPFALLDDQVIDINFTGLLRGKACRCRCLGCGGPLIARLGAVNKPHFAHLGETAHANSSCLETSLHYAAKEMLRSLPSIWTPPVLRSTSLSLPGFCPQIIPEVLFELDHVILEKTIRSETGGVIKPDAIAAFDVVDEVAECIAYRDHLIIEICVTHTADARKIQLLPEFKTKSLEIVLDRNSIYTHEQLREALYASAPRTWLYHPQVEELNLKMQALIEVQKLIHDREDALRSACAERDQKIIDYVVYENSVMACSGPDSICSSEVTQSFPPL